MIQLTSEILKACENKDQRAQKALYEIYFRMHISLCYSYYGNEEDARSILNCGFLKICDHIQSIEKNPKVFYSWTRKILMNSIIDEYRSNKKYLEHIDFSSSDREIEFSSPDFNLGIESLQEADIKRMISLLPDKTRKVFVLYVLEGFNHLEIGNLLGINEGTSKWHLSIARKLLREMLDRVEGLEKAMGKAAG